MCGCAQLVVDEAKRELTVVGAGDAAGTVVATLREGDALSLNGHNGDVLLGARPLAPPAMSPAMSRFMDEARRVLPRLSLSLARG